MREVHWRCQRLLLLQLNGRQHTSLVETHQPKKALLAIRQFGLNSQKEKTNLTRYFEVFLPLVRCGTFADLHLGYLSHP